MCVRVYVCAYLGAHVVMVRFFLRRVLERDELRAEFRRVREVEVHDSGGTLEDGKEAGDGGSQCGFRARGEGFLGWVR